MYPYFFPDTLRISVYALFTFLALFTVIFGGYFFARFRGFEKKDAFIMLFSMSVSAFLGARLFNVFVNFPYYSKHLEKIFSLNAEGFSLYGGLLGAIISGLIVSKIRKIDLFTFADTLTPFVGIGIILMRIGCFLNGCCFGKQTDMPWGVKFPMLSNVHIHQLNENVLAGLNVSPVHPTQLYEAFFSLMCVVFAFFALKRKFRDGTVFLICGALFSAFRWGNMYFRDLSYPDLVLKFVYPGVYLAVILLCIFLVFIRAGKSNKKNF